MSFRVFINDSGLETEIGESDSVSGAKKLARTYTGRHDLKWQKDGAYAQLATNYGRDDSVGLWIEKD